MRKLLQNLAVLRDIEAFPLMLAGYRSGAKASAHPSAKLVTANTSGPLVPPSSYSDPFTPAPLSRQASQAR
jgi:hypothetical protein